MEFFAQAVNVLKILVMAVGAGLGAWGVINLMEGYGNDNPGAKSKLSFSYYLSTFARSGISLSPIRTMPPPAISCLMP